MTRDRLGQNQLLHVSLRRTDLRLPGGGPRRASALVLEVKGEFCYKVRALLKKLGREADYVEVRLDGRHREPWILRLTAAAVVAHAGATQFMEVRMAPVYDAVTTRVFPHLEPDRMALELNGKDDKLRRADFRALGATTMGLRAAVIDEAIDTMHTRVGGAWKS